MWAVYSQILYCSRRTEIMSNFNVLAPNIDILTEDSLRPLGLPILDGSIPVFINNQITKFTETFDRLSQINPHMALFILWVCPKFTYVHRCSHFWKFESLFSSAYDMTRDILIEILNCPLNDCYWFKLPARYGGLDIRRLFNVVLFYLAHSLHFAPRFSVASLAFLCVPLNWCIYPTPEFQFMDIGQTANEIASTKVSIIFEVLAEYPDQ